MLEKTSIAISIFLILCFFIYKLYSKKNYLIILPIFYLFVSLWVALGFAESSLNETIWPIENKHIVKTYFVFICSSISFYMGISIIKEKKSKGGFDLGKIRSILFRLKGRQIFTIYILSILLMHIAYPIEFLYFREGYSPLYNGNNKLQTLFDLVVLILVLILPFYKKKIVRYFLFFLILIFLQGLNKRIIVLIPIMYFVGCYVRDLKFNYLKLLVLVLISFFFAAIVFSYRNNFEQGIISNIIYFFNNGLDFELAVEGIDYLFGYSFVATLVTSNFFGVTVNDFLISISPLPSSFIDVSSVVEKHKITIFAPYSALGTLGSLGFSYIFSFYFFTGLIFNYCRNYFPSRFTMASLLIFLLFLSFVAFSLQYQLRSTSRFFYYVIYYFIIFKFISFFTSGFSKHKKSFFI